MRLSRFTGPAATLLLVAGAAACGSSSTGGTDPGLTPAIAISLSPTSLSIVQGASGTLTASITRSGGFTGTVNVVTEGAPAGVSAAVSNVATSGGTTSGTVTVTVGAAVAPGTFNLTIRASGSGVSDVTAQLALTVTAAPVASFDIATIAPDPVTVAQATTSGNVTITLSRSNSTATINLTLEGAPAGVTGAFAPAAATGTTSTLTLQVGNTVAPGNYTLTVRGTATGLADKTKTFVLAVTASSFALTTTPGGPVTVQQTGAAVNVTVNVNRTNFAGAVALAVTGNPAGLTAQLTPPSTTGNASTLALSASGVVAVGSYTLTITGTAAGMANQQVTLGVNVTAAPGGGSNVSLDFSACLASQPTWLAYQDGPGAGWTVVTPVGTVYTFSVSNAKVGLATANGTGNNVAVAYYAKSEVTALSGIVQCGGTAPTGKSVTGTVANLGATQTGIVSLGGGFGAASGLSPNVTVTGVKNGTHDLVAYARDLLAVGTNDRAVLRRDVNTTAIPAAGSLGAVIDFTGAESFAPATATITLGGLVGGEQLVHGMTYRVGASCEGATLYGGAIASGSTFTAYGIPAGQQRGTDSHGLSIAAINGTTTFRSMIRSFAALTAQTITLPSTMPVVTPVAVAGPYLRFQFVYTLPSDLLSIATASYSETATGKSAGLVATSAYLGGAAVDLTFPDFSGLAGWSNAWMPATGAIGTWTLLGTGAQTSTGPCSAGQAAVTSVRTGNF